MAEEATLYSSWKKKFDSESDLHDRHDEDMGIYNLDAFTLTDHNGDTLDDVYNENINYPKVWANAISEGLWKSFLQPKITRENGETDEECAKLENTLRLLYTCLDTYLSFKKEPPLLNILSGQVVVRGGTIGVLWLYDDGGELIPHINMWDRRYSAYTVGRKGITLGGVESIISADKLYSDYGIETEDKTVKLAEIWNSEKNEVYKDGEKIDAVGSDGGILVDIMIDLKRPYTPVIAHEVGASIWHKDDDFSKYVGESIYSQVRTLVPGYNRILSLCKTLTMRAFTNGIQFSNPQGAQANIPADVTDENKVLAIPIDSKFTSMPLNDLNQAAMMLERIFAQMWLYGTGPEMLYGHMDSSETVAQITTKASRVEGVYLPRRIAIQMFYDDLAYMLLTQLNERKLPNEIFLRGRVIKVPEIPNDLSQFVIKHKLTILNPQQDIANTALAQAQAPFRGLKSILENVLQVDDTTRELKDKERDDIKRMMPLISAYSVMAEMLEDEDPNVKAQGQLIGMQIGSAMGQPSDIKPGDSEYPGRPLAPLVGGK